MRSWDGASLVPEAGTVGVSIAEARTNTVLTPLGPPS